jgi:hypothetical protein
MSAYISRVYNLEWGWINMSLVYYFRHVFRLFRSLRFLFNLHFSIRCSCYIVHYRYFIDDTVLCACEGECDMAGNVRVMQHWCAIVQPLLQWERNEYYTTWVCVFVALGIQHAMRMHYIVICGLPHSTVFFHISHKWYDFRKKKSYWTQNVCFDFLYSVCLKHFSF